MRVVSSLGFEGNERLVLRSVQLVGTVAQERMTKAENKAPFSPAPASPREGSVFWKWGPQQAVSEGGMVVPTSLLCLPPCPPLDPVSFFLRQALPKWWPDGPQQLLDSSLPSSPLAQRSALLLTSVLGFTLLGPAWATCHPDTNQCGCKEHADELGPGNPAPLETGQCGSPAWTAWPEVGNIKAL